MKAVDADAGKNALVSYSMQSADSNFRFDIDTHTGAILLTDRLTSADINATYRLTITATDAGNPPLTSAIVIIIKVLFNNVT